MRGKKRKVGVEKVDSVSRIVLFHSMAIAPGNDMVT